MTWIATHWPALVPVVIEVLWLVVYLPIDVRRWHRQRVFAAEFAQFFDMNQVHRHWENRWTHAFLLYHLPVLPIVFLALSLAKSRHPLLTTCLPVALATAGYTVVAASACES